MNIEPCRIPPGSELDLREVSTRVSGSMKVEKVKDEFARLSERLAELQELLFAWGERGLLVVFQAMDAGGKDSTIRHVFRSLDPAGLHVKSFKVPTPRERRHDFLWRIHAHVPPQGTIAVFNRSHYEDVVAVRVRELVEPHVWRGRIDHINAFERLLVDEGTVVLKFFLHISKAYQKERLERRLARPEKRWKFEPDDLADRARWDDYLEAYSEAIRRSSTETAPWYVVPAEDRPLRDLVVLQAVVDRLEALPMRYPEVTFDPSTIEIL